MKLGDLRHATGAVKKRKRLGKGRGTGKGTTAGRGTKGQGARSGDGGVPRWFEGGQMPIQRRLPKRGFHRIQRVPFQVVNVFQLSELGAGEVTRETLVEHGLVRKNGGPVKLLAEGEIEKAVNVRVDAASRSARDKVEKAGGSVELPAPKAKKE